jgi:hypothetical protein
MCDFADVKLATSIQVDYSHAISIKKLASLNDYSAFMLKEVHGHVHTPHMLIVQHDGWVLNPAVWSDGWLLYDYVGPLFLQDTVAQPWSVGSGGFSLRSTKLMKYISSILPPWDGQASWDRLDGKNNWAHEDGVISIGLRDHLQTAGFKFAPPEEAAKFAYGGNHNFYCPRPFGYHGFYAIDKLNGGKGDGSAPWINPSGAKINY